MLQHTLSFIAGQSARFLADAADGKVVPSWTWHHELPGWLPVWTLAPMFLLVAALVIYLYRAQQRIATRRVIVTLTTLRVLLILLMFLILLGPIRQFIHRGTSGGSLWLVVDQSGSMGRSDEQASPVEKLRWADAAGLLPPDARPSALDRVAQKLSALRQQADYCQVLTRLPADEKDAPKRMEELVKSLKKWNAQLAETIDAVTKDPVGKTSAPAQDALKPLHAAYDSVARGIDQTQTRPKPEAAAGDVPWKDVQTALATAAAALETVADKTDQQLARDPKLAGALDKVGKMTRAQLAVLDLTGKSRHGAGASSALQDAMDHDNLRVLGFGMKSEVVGAGKGPDKVISTALSNPSSPATDIAGALRAIAAHVPEDQPAAVILVSDGRQNTADASPSEPASRLAARGIRVFTLAMGTDALVRDAAVESIDAPEWIFKDDTLKVSAMLTLDGLANQPITVELRRGQTTNGAFHEETVDHQTFKVDASGASPNSPIRHLVTFREDKTKRPGPGLYDYSIVIQDVPGEATTKNNRRTARVSVKDRPLSVLVIEDQPRWEYRYLVSYLADLQDNHSQRVNLQTVLLQPALIAKVTPPEPVKASPDNKRREAQILPDTQEEWNKFGLIILGDLPPDALSHQNQEFIAKAVADRGASLVLMAGPLNLPGSWGANRTENPLTELFPVEVNPDWTPQALQEDLRYGYHPAIAPEGVDSLLTQFGIDEASNAKDWDLIRTDPDLAWYWHSDFTQIKGGAESIWMIADNQRPGAHPAAPGLPPGAETAERLGLAKKRALLATMNMGNGKVLYLSGDSLWRLRQVNGQDLHARFWGQVIRWVVSGDLPAGGQFVRFGTDKPRYVAGESAIVTARVMDRHLAPLKGQQIKVIARVVPQPGAPADAHPPAQVEAEMAESPESPGQYRAVLGNLPSGHVQLSLAGGQIPDLLDNDPTATQKTLDVDVENELNLEERNLNADSHTMRSVADAGVGVAMPGPYADQLAEQLPDLNYPTVSAEQIGLFTDPDSKYAKYTHWGVLILFAGLITAEWLVRKAGGLV